MVNINYIYGLKCLVISRPIIILRHIAWTNHSSLIVQPYPWHCSCMFGWFQHNSIKLPLRTSSWSSSFTSSCYGWSSSLSSSSRCSEHHQMTSSLKHSGWSVLRWLITPPTGDHKHIGTPLARHGFTARVHSPACTRLRTMWSTNIKLWNTTPPPPHNNPTPNSQALSTPFGSLWQRHVYHPKWAAGL